jgi:hypothetical protein
MEEVCWWKPAWNAFELHQDSLQAQNSYLFLYGVPKLECEIRLRTYCSPKQSKPADEVVAKAKEMLESKKQGGTRYGFFFNNCEDLATLCKTGTAFCTQSELLFGRVGYPILKQLVQSS